MLLAFLQSVARSHPGAGVSVYWQDMPESLIGAVRAAFPNVEFVQTGFDFAGDKIQRISSKVLCWARAAEEHSGDLVFADGDTLVRRDLAGFFKTDADVVFTTKPENVPLNTGVILTRGDGAPFMRAWRDATTRILQTPELFAQANDSSKPYGGTDQMSLYQMLGLENPQALYELECEGRKLRIRTEPCSRLNETNSRPLSEEICVVHYKAGWQQILLHGRPFSQWRTRAASWEMLTFFLETFADGLERANAATGQTLTAKDFGIAWPGYWRAGKFSAPRYAAWRVRAALERGWLIVSGRMRPGM